MNIRSPALSALHTPKFRFREEEISRIHHCWSSGQSVLLTGIRRTGKSEVLKAALYRYAQQQFAVAYLDVQDQNSLPRFYQDLLRVLLDHGPVSMARRLSEALNSMTNVPGKLANWVRGQIRSIALPGTLEVELTPPDSELVRYWTPLADQISQVLAEQEAASLPVIGIDELPFMLENLIRAGVDKAELVILLASLRKLRDAGLRFGIAGSISFENLLTLLGIPHTVLGGLSRQSIPAFTRAEAREYLGENLRGRPAGEAEAIQNILDDLPDYVPEFLVITENQLYPCRDAEACRTALRQQVLPAIRRSFLNQFDERLDKNYTTSEIPTAHRILDGIARADASGDRIDGARLPDDYRKVLLKLEYDNFLMQGEDFKWRFSLNLIRLWWRAQRGMS